MKFVSSNFSTFSTQTLPLRQGNREKWFNEKISGNTAHQACYRHAHYQSTLLPLHQTRGEINCITDMYYTYNVCTHAYTQACEHACTCSHSNAHMLTHPHTRARALAPPSLSHTNKQARTQTCALACAHTHTHTNTHLWGRRVGSAGSNTGIKQPLLRVKSVTFIILQRYLQLCFSKPPPPLPLIKEKKKEKKKKKENEDKWQRLHQSGLVMSNDAETWFEQDSVLLLALANGAHTWAAFPLASCSAWCSITRCLPRSFVCGSCGKYQS